MQERERELPCRPFVSKSALEPMLISREGQRGEVYIYTYYIPETCFVFDIHAGLRLDYFCPHTNYELYMRSFLLSYEQMPRQCNNVYVYIKQPCTVCACVCVLLFHLGGKEKWSINLSSVRGRESSSSFAASATCFRRYMLIA